MAEIALKCCTCGETIDVFVSRQPSFGFELYEIASKIGWEPAMDLNYNRTLIFCSDGCLKRQLTKGGYFRKNLLRAEKSDALGVTPKELLEEVENDG